MTNFTIDAVTREDMGKGASRRLRREAGLVPAIVYGANKAPVSISLKDNEIRKALQHEAFYSNILDLTIDGKKEKVVIKDIQRHPYKPSVLHLDFQRVRADQKLTMHIPLHIIGEENAPGKKDGGVVAHLVNELEVSCLPADLPEYIEVDISTLELDQAVHLSQITAPKGVEFVSLSHDNDLTLVSIHLAKVEAEPEEEATKAEKGAEGETSAEGEEGAAKEAPEGGEKGEEQSSD
ncbi:MAG: 50S ribosomal protein L25/general stress protein Ctc [Gammaproteobacteria bacterium]